MELVALCSSGPVVFPLPVSVIQFLDICKGYFRRFAGKTVVLDYNISVSSAVEYYSSISRLCKKDVPYGGLEVNYNSDVFRLPL